MSLTKACAYIIVIRRARTEAEKMVATPALVTDGAGLPVPVRADTDTDRALVQQLAIHDHLAGLHLALVSTGVARRRADRGLANEPDRRPADDADCDGDRDGGGARAGPLSRAIAAAGGRASLPAGH